MGAGDIAIWAFATGFPVALILIFQRHLNEIFSKIEETMKTMTKIGDHNSNIYVKRLEDLEDKIGKLQLQYDSLLLRIEQGEIQK